MRLRDIYDGRPAAQPDPASIARSFPPGNRETQAARTPEPERPTPEILTAQVLAEFEADDVSRILVAWRDLLGIELDRDRIARHLKDLRTWQGR